MKQGHGTAELDIHEQLRIVTDIAITCQRSADKPVQVFFVFMQKEGKVVQILLLQRFDDIRIDVAGSIFAADAAAAG